MSSEVAELELNAFVDGELSPTKAAQVAAVIATDPKIAQRVARLHKMKAALSGLADDLSLPDLPRTIPARVSAWCIPIGLSSVVAVLIVLLWSGPALGPVRQDTELPRIARHDNWAVLDTTNVRLELPKGFDWLDPVMRASGLQLVHRARAGDVKQLGFKGPNGCRISLFVAEKRTPDSPLRLNLSEHVQHAHWRIGSIEFEMIARDMAPARFATVATSLHRNSRDHTSDDALHIALVEAARLRCTA